MNTFKVLKPIFGTTVVIKIKNRDCHNFIVNLFRIIRIYYPIASSHLITIFLLNK